MTTPKRKFQRPRASKQVALTFGGLCTILLIIGGLFFFGLRTIEESNRIQQSRALSKLALIDDIGRDVGQLQAEVLSAVLASDPREILALNHAVQGLEATDAQELATYGPLVDTARERALYVQVMAEQKNYWAMTQPVLVLSRDDDDAAATRAINTRQGPAYNRFLTAVDELIKLVESEAAATAAQTTHLISKLRKIGDLFVGAAILIAVGTGFSVAAVGRRLERDKLDLQTEVKERQQAVEELNWKTALLEAQVDSSIDGILVVDAAGKKTLQNKRLVEVLKIPPDIAADLDDATQLRWVSARTRHPDAFVGTVARLNAHPQEIGRDEVEFADGTILDRYSAPLTGRDGKYYGRMWTFRDITDRKRNDEALRLLGTAVEQAKESILITDAELDLPGPRIVFVNAAFTKMTGYAAEDVLGKTPRILQGPQTDRSVLRRLRQNLAQGEVFEGEAINYGKGGKEFCLEWRIAPIRTSAGLITHFVAVQHDVTERKRLEGQLIQSQKMETVGKLAGGIAHEFNSILTAIIGQSELLLGDLPARSPLRKCAIEIGTAAGRAASLTRQLLAYGRKQILKPEVLDLNLVVASMRDVFQHLMGGAVDTQVVPAPNLRAVRVDAGQIEQVIMNMAINARDAMPTGGKLTLETANVSFDRDSVGRYPELKPGDYVMLAISDTGLGMSPEVKARLFEPFYSTKGVGQGTGLGLSTCYGIVKQSGGHISVYSELARGTTFKIYLPQVEAQAVVPVRRLDATDLPQGTETILLVEDDPALREMAATLLRRLGYQVLAAANGVEALSLQQQRSTGHVDLLFTDVVMPHMSGKELSERVRVLYPYTKILFTSAYTENAIVHQGMLVKDMGLLQKPFTPSALAHKLREVLDGPASAAAAESKLG